MSNQEKNIKPKSIDNTEKEINELELEIENLISKGNLEGYLKLLKKEEIEPDELDLENAIEYKQVEFVSYLINNLRENGKELNNGNEDEPTLYELACETGHKEIISLFEKIDIKELINNDGIPKYPCPFCKRFRPIGRFDWSNCEHFITTDDMYGGNNPIFDDYYAEIDDELDDNLSPDRLIWFLGRLDDDINIKNKFLLLLKSAPKKFTIIFNAFEENNTNYWKYIYSSDIRKQEGIIDESSGRWEYYDYYAIDGEKIREMIYSDSEEMLKWIYSNFDD